MSHEFPTAIDRSSERKVMHQICDGIELSSKILLEEDDDGELKTEKNNWQQISSFHFTDEKSSSSRQYPILIFESSKYVIVVFSDSVGDKNDFVLGFLKNMKWETKYKIRDTPVSLHKRFADFADSCFNNAVGKKMTDFLKDGKQVILAGYGLGAAVATAVAAEYIATTEMKSNHDNALIIVSMGCPRIWRTKASAHVFDRVLGSKNHCRISSVNEDYSSRVDLVSMDPNQHQKDADVALSTEALLEYRQFAGVFAATCLLHHSGMQQHFSTKHADRRHGYFYNRRGGVSSHHWIYYASFFRDENHWDTSNAINPSLYTLCKKSVDDAEELELTEEQFAEIESRINAYIGDGLDSNSIDNAVEQQAHAFSEQKKSEAAMYHILKPKAWYPEEVVRCIKTLPMQASTWKLFVGLIVVVAIGVLGWKWWTKNSN